MIPNNIILKKSPLEDEQWQILAELHQADMDCFQWDLQTGMLLGPHQHD